MSDSHADIAETGRARLGRGHASLMIRDDSHGTLHASGEARDERRRLAYTYGEGRPRHLLENGRLNIAAITRYWASTAYQENDQRAG